MYTRRAHFNLPCADQLTQRTTRQAVSCLAHQGLDQYNTNGTYVSVIEQIIISWCPEYTQHSPVVSAVAVKYAVWSEMVRAGVPAVS
jgi:hypothetical protein